jgi:hypothetical protein
MMNPPKPLAGRFEKEVIVAETLWLTLEVGVERMPYSADELARVVNEATGLNMRHELVTRYIEEMVNDGSIVRRGPVYGTNENGLNIGRNYGWTLAVTYDEALDRIRARQEADAARWAAGRDKAVAASIAGRARAAQERKAQSKADATVAFATRDTEDTRAIAGPEPVGVIATKLTAAIRKAGRNTDDASALVEAARQYADRGSTMSTQIDELVRTAESMGLSVDRAALEQTLSFEPDERLETVALVLPYITMLEAALERGQDNIRELRRKYADYDEIKRDLRVLREKHGASVSQRVATSN